MNTKKDLLYIDDFKNISLLYKNKKIEFKTYEELISKVLLNLLMNDSKTNLVIGVERNLSVILFLVINAITSYFENMKNPNNRILDLLVDGDKVVYNNNIGIYKGISKINHKEYITLEDSKGGKTYVLVENQHLITQYTGNKKRISKLEGFSTGGNITKDFVAKFMCVNSNELAGVITESTLVVVNGKEELFDLINSVGIIYDEKQYTLHELFPFAYFSSEENYEYFKGKKNNENVLIKFCSNINTALDIIRKDKGIRSVVLLGEKSYKDVLETKLRMLELRKDIKKITIFDTWDSTFDFSHLLNRDDSYYLYAVTKDVITKEINLNENIIMPKGASIQNESRHLINKFIDKNSSFFNVDKSNEIYRITNKIYINLQGLCSDSINNFNALEFVKLAYNTCNVLEQSVLPLNWCINSKENILGKIKRLKEICHIYDVTRFEFKVMQEVIDGLEEFILKIEVKNNKFDKLKEIVKGNSKTLLILKNDFEIIEFKRSYMRYRIGNVKVAKLKKNINYKDYDCVIFSFPYDNRYFNVFNNPEISNLVFVLHGRENYKFKRILSANKKMMKYIDENNKLFNQLEEPNVIEKECFTDYYEDKNENSDIEESIESVLSENWLQILLHNTQVLNSNNNNSTMLVKSIIKFEDNKYALLSDNYQLNIIDRKNNDIKQKSRGDIDVGEELVFANTKIPGKGDIIKDTIEKLLEDKTFNMNYGDFFKLNYMWKNLLVDYIENNNLLIKDIATTFKAVYGETVEPITITNWLEGNIIGPRNLNHIKIVSEIVKDEELSRQLDNVIDACRSVRSIQVQIRKAIAKMIISSVVSGQNGFNDEIYKSVKSVIKDFNECVYIGTIATIENVNMNVSGAYINRILDEEIE